MVDPGDHHLWKYSFICRPHIKISTDDGGVWPCGQQECVCIHSLLLKVRFFRTSLFPSSFEGTLLFNQPILFRKNG